jgi:putative transposase
MRRYTRVKVPGATYFFTLVTEQRRTLLGEPRVVALLLDAVEKVRARHPFCVDAYVILPDHLHALWTLPESDSNFSTRWRLIKEAFTRAYMKSRGAPPRSDSRRVKGEQGIWQRRFWEHAIRNEADFMAHLDYIHFNPVRHGLVAAARDWPHSSFRHWVMCGGYDESWGSQEPPLLPQHVGHE